MVNKNKNKSKYVKQFKGVSPGDYFAVRLPPELVQPPLQPSAGRITYL